MSTNEKKDQTNEKKDEDLELTEEQTEKVAGGRTRSDGVGGSQWLPTDGE